VGVVLEVKANATPDRRIDLELKPEVTEFQGFINYGQNVTTLPATLDRIPTEIDVTADNSTPLTVVQGNALTPVFSLRTVETKVQVVDGQTVVMGGFIRSDNQDINDKVPLLGDLPLLGRLFRSKVSHVVKRNLVMFITARMVQPDGTPQYLTEGEKESQEVSLLPSQGESKK